MLPVSDMPMTPTARRTSSLAWRHSGSIPFTVAASSTPRAREVTAQARLDEPRVSLSCPTEPQQERHVHGELVIGEHCASASVPFESPCSSCSSTIETAEGDPIRSTRCAKPGTFGEARHRHWQDGADFPWMLHAASASPAVA